jgi:NAD(P)-dependent dehydrogenase (short-subunit alcohol dehydrogenase family)
MKRVVLITGVCGGIGRATAALFDASGWHVVGTDSNMQEPLSFGRQRAMDLLGPGAIPSIVRSIKEREGRLDALVNNAAIFIKEEFADYSTSAWDLTMSTNVIAPYSLVREAYPLLKERQGAIVNVSSIHAVATSPKSAPYAASKAALVALTKSMAVEFIDDGVRANAVLPGAIRTKMLREKKDRDNRYVGEPRDVASAILFLADNTQSSFITGQCLVVDGGVLSRLSTG